MSDDDCGVADRRFRWLHLGALEPTGGQQEEVGLHVKTSVSPLQSSLENSANQHSCEMCAESWSTWSNTSVSL